MSRRIAVIVVVGIAVSLGIGGCAAQQPGLDAPPVDADSSADPTPAETPDATPSPIGGAALAAVPASCDELLGPDVLAELGGRALTLRPTDDTIQGRFSGVGNSADFARGLSCAYGSDSGEEERFEFGVELLTPEERTALLDVLRAGPGEQTTGLTEEGGGDAIRFTQLGDPASENVVARWGMVFVVHPDSWTMVWSPVGGETVRMTQDGFSAAIEQRLYSAS